MWSRELYIWINNVWVLLTTRRLDNQLLTQEAKLLFNPRNIIWNLSDLPPCHTISSKATKNQMRVIR